MKQKISRFYQPASKMWTQVRDYLVPGIYPHRLGLPDPPRGIFGGQLCEEEARAAAIWRGAYEERASAYLRWECAQLAIAANAADQLIAKLKSMESDEALRLVRALCGPEYTAVFGADEWAAAPAAISERCSTNVGVDVGAHLAITIRTAFGGGDNWFGLPGNRYYTLCVGLPNSITPPTFPRDPGVEEALRIATERAEQLFAAEMAAKREAWNRTENAWMRVRSRLAKHGVSSDWTSRDEQFVRESEKARRWAEQFKACNFRAEREIVPARIWPGKTVVRGRKLGLVHSGATWLRVMAA